MIVQSGRELGDFTVLQTVDILLSWASPEFVRSVLSHPRVWANLRQDEVDAGNLKYESKSMYIRWEQHGFVMFRRVTVPMWEIHIAMLPKQPYAGPFVQAAMAEMRRCGARKFLALIPEWNRACVVGARAEGFVEEGCITSAYIRDGRSYASIVMGSF